MGCCQGAPRHDPWPDVDDGEHFLYYWDDRDGQAYQGWWVTPAVGSNNFEAVLRIRSAVPEGDAREDALLAGELMAPWSTELWYDAPPRGVTDRMRWRAARAEPLAMPLVDYADGQGAHPCPCMRVTIVEGLLNETAFRNFVLENGFNRNMFSIEGLYVHEGRWNHGSRVYRKVRAIGALERRDDLERWVAVDSAPHPPDQNRVEPFARDRGDAARPCDEPATWAEWFGFSANPGPEPATGVENWSADDADEAQRSAQISYPVETL